MTIYPTTTSTASEPDCTVFAAAVDSKEYDEFVGTTWRRHPILMAARPLRRRPPRPGRSRTRSHVELPARVRSMPIGTWTDGRAGRDIHHSGPMAQDFWNSFGFGNSDRRIDLGDSAGIYMVTICEMADRVEDLHRRFAEYEHAPADHGVKS